MAETEPRVSSVQNRVWASWRVGEKYGNGIEFFVGGADFDEFLANLSGVGGTALADLLVKEWDAHITEFLPSKNPVTPDQAIKNLRGGGLIGDEPQHEESLSCPHGPRVKRSGEKSGKKWTAWFCPLDKGDPNQCKPIFK